MTSLAFVDTRVMWARAIYRTVVLDALDRCIAEAKDRGI